jgi:2-oxoglutarate dehydrogenase complex dehydrogenase (E1) component-like enzyme
MKRVEPSIEPPAISVAWHVMFGRVFSQCDGQSKSEGSLQEKLTRLFFKYRDMGHEMAKVNPLATEDD